MGGGDLERSMHTIYREISLLRISGKVRGGDRDRSGSGQLCDTQDDSRKKREEVWAIFVLRTP